jgi:hypothetical protein
MTKSFLGTSLPGLCALFAIAGLAAQGDNEKKIGVRLLEFKREDPTFIIRVGGQSKLTTLADAAALEKLVGKNQAKSLVDLVDFAKDKIVLVSWTTSGPPEWKLEYTVAGAGQERRLTFYVQGPPGAGARGQRARIGADFFAVPKNLARIL